MDTNRNASTTIDFLNGAEYRKLLEAKANLDFLKSCGVDNWQGYATLPDIDDYDTIAEWQAACEEASNSYW